MMNPLTFYTRMASATFSMFGNARHVSETMSASHVVIAKRTKMMATATFSPLHGNYDELGRMVPEKMAAFGEAGSAIASDWQAMQLAFAAELQNLVAVAMKGRPPTLSEWSALSARNAKFALRTFERASAMGGKSLKPIHAAATGNAARLERGTA
ncbi:hypothetical protein [Novosphingobium lentum]|uniref:hypothetical protein n=1 Tax=Novosphingobium lentum TaxID=145287 RepID=UPI00083474CA|nr:hypothetical protein [Novosphingobium lentum]